MSALTVTTVSSWLVLSIFLSDVHAFEFLTNEYRSAQANTGMDIV
jgi:hypothetical protein